MSHAYQLMGESPAGGDLPSLPLSPHPNYVTARGLAQLHARLAGTEQDLGQLPPDASLEREYLLRTIRWLQARIASAILVQPRETGQDRAGFGACVELVDQDDRHGRYRIVGEDEADPDKGLVSWVSPLGKALTGARVGDTVVWRRPDGDVDIEILRISFDGAPEPASAGAIATRN